MSHVSKDELSKRTLSKVATPKEFKEYLAKTIEEKGAKLVIVDGDRGVGKSTLIYEGGLPLAEPHVIFGDDDFGTLYRPEDKEFSEHIVKTRLWQKIFEAMTAALKTGKIVVLEGWLAHLWFQLIKDYEGRDLKTEYPVLTVRIVRQTGAHPLSYEKQSPAYLLSFPHSDIDLLIYLTQKRGIYIFSKESKEHRRAEARRDSPVASPRALAKGPEGPEGLFRAEVRKIYENSERFLYFVNQVKELKPEIDVVIESVRKRRSDPSQVERLTKTLERLQDELIEDWLQGLFQIETKDYGKPKFILDAEKRLFIRTLLAFDRKKSASEILTLLTTLSQLDYDLIIEAKTAERAEVRKKISDKLLVVSGKWNKKEDRRETNDEYAFVGGRLDKRFQTEPRGQRRLLEEIEARHKHYPFDPSLRGGSPGQANQANRNNSRKAVADTILTKKGVVGASQWARSAEGPSRQAMLKSALETASLRYGLKGSNMRKTLSQPPSPTKHKIKYFIDYNEYMTNRKSKAEWEKMLADPKVQREVWELSGKEITPETAFELGRVIGAFNPKYSREVLIAMLRALRVANHQISQELIPVYLREIMDSFRAKGIPLPEPSQGAGAQIFLYQGLPSKSEIAALVFTFAMNPKSRGEVVIFGKLTTQEAQKWEEYKTRLASVTSIHGTKLSLNFHEVDSREAPRRLQQLASELSSWLTQKGVAEGTNSLVEKRVLARHQIVVTMPEELAQALPREDSIRIALTGLREIRYERPANLFEAFPRLWVAHSLSKTTYELLSRSEQRMLQELSRGQFHFNREGIPSAWSVTSQIARAQILEILAQAA